jgi:hypothetical protein
MKPKAHQRRESVARSLFVRLRVLLPAVPTWHPARMAAIATPLVEAGMGLDLPPVRSSTRAGVSRSAPSGRCPRGWVIQRSRASVFVAEACLILVRSRQSRKPSAWSTRPADGFDSHSSPARASMRRRPWRGRRRSPIPARGRMEPDDPRCSKSALYGGVSACPGPLAACRPGRATYPNRSGRWCHPPGPSLLPADSRGSRGRCGSLKNEHADGGGESGSSKERHGETPCWLEPPDDRSRDAPRPRSVAD